MSDRYEVVLSRAARPTVEATLETARRCPDMIRLVLEDMTQRIYKPGFRLREFEKRLGSDAWFADNFRRCVGLTPWRFVQECRMETASRLLRDTQLSVEEVSLLVGYQAVVPLWRLSWRWCGMAPAAFRTRIRGVRHHLETFPPDGVFPDGVFPDGVFSWRFWRRCAHGELSNHERASLIAYLELVSSDQGQGVEP